MSVATPTTNYYKYTTDGKNYIIKEVVEEEVVDGISSEKKTYSKAKVTGEFENNTFKEDENVISLDKVLTNEELVEKLTDGVEFENMGSFEVQEEQQTTGGRRRRSKSSKKRVKKSRKGGKAKKSKKVRKH